MNSTDTVFSTYHPVIQFAYALFAPVMAMMTSHPVYMLVNLIMAFFISGFYMGAQRACRTGIKLLLAVSVIGGMNFFFNTRGMHVLFRIGNHPFTLESLLYGLVSGGMLAAVILWFQCFNLIVSNDKFLYLFGKKFPGTALLLSMILKLFPDTKYRMQCIKYADKDVTGDSSPTLSARLSKSLWQISALLEWSMEESIDMADSMKARGYGEGKRSTWQYYRWRTGDSLMALFAAAFGGSALAGIIYHNMQIRWYPVIQLGEGTEMLVLTCVCYAGVLALPLLAEGKARCMRKW